MRDEIYLLFAVVCGSALIPIFARQVRIPSAVLEIIFGIVLFSFPLKNQPQWFLLLKEMGLIYLMFIVGMELDLRRFFREKKSLFYVLIPLLSLVVMPILFHKMGYPFFIGISLSMISAGIILPVLKEYELMDTELGDSLIGIALTGELMAILVLMGTDIHHRYGLTLRAMGESVKFLLLTVIAALFLRFLYVIAWWNPQKVEKVMESEDPVEEGIRAVLFIIVAGALIAYVSGLEPLLGSFMAGLVFSYVFRSKGRFEDKINAVGFGFFIPFFFIGVGADLDISLLMSSDNIFLSLALSGFVFLGKASPIVLTRFLKITKTEAIGMALLLSAPLSMMVVAATIGLKTELITEPMKDLLVLTAIISSIAFPSIFRMISGRLKKTKAPEA
jgi:Kef-type K+ transport system membrane component KefB